MKIRKLNGECNIYLIMLFLCSLPKSLDYFFPLINDVMNGFIILFSFVIVCFYLFYCISLKKMIMHDFSKIIIIYFMFLFFSTIINQKDVFFYSKVYGTNIIVIILLELIFHNKYKKYILEIYAHANTFFITLNTLLMIKDFIMGYQDGSIYGSHYYLLGIDNRIILYIVIDILILICLYHSENRKEYIIECVYVYLVGTITLIKIWSVTSMVVLILVGMGFIFFLIFDQVAFPERTVFIIVTVVNFGFVFFNLEKNVSYILVNILRKTVTMSYRTLIWGKAFNELLSAPAHFIYGFGYSDTTELLRGIHGVNHLHNIIVDPLFAGGIVGLILYAWAGLYIVKKIGTFKKTKIGKMIGLLGAGIYLMLIFDTFEMFQLYYVILFMLACFDSFYKRKTEEKGFV